MSYANFVQAKLGAAMTSNQTSMVLTAAIAPFQLPPADGGTLVLTDSMGSPSFVEIVSYTARTGLNLTGVVRGLEGTTARAWIVGSYLYQPLTASGYQSALDSKASAADVGNIASALATINGV